MFTNTERFSITKARSHICVAPVKPNQLARLSMRMKPFGKDGTDYSTFYIVKFDINVLNTFKFE